MPLKLTFTDLYILSHPSMHKSPQATAGFCVCGGKIYIYAAYAGLHILYLVLLYGGLQGRAKTPPYRAKGKGARRGEQCSPEELYGSARFCGLAPTRPKSLPCVKGGAPQGRRDCDITGAGRFSGKVTIPHRLRRSPLYTRGPFTLLPQDLFWPRRGQTERDGKALRKMQHSCIF